jgi:hypothetical protein
MKHGEAFLFAFAVGAMLTSSALLIRSCAQLSADAVDRENVRYLRDVYEQPCMMSNGNCGRHPAASAERAQCLVECINRLHKADVELESAMKAVR